MPNIHYLIRYHDRFNQIDEIFTDIYELNKRIIQLNNGYYEDVDDSFHDCVHIDGLYVYMK